MSAVLSSDEQRAKRSSGVDARDLEDSVCCIRHRFQLLLICVCSCAADRHRKYRPHSTVTRSGSVACNAFAAYQSAWQVLAQLAAEC